MTVNSIEDFLKLLLASKVLGPAEVARLSTHDYVNPQELARSLSESGHLSRWQAQQLLDGNHRLHLGKYQLLDQVGEGGMGAVYKALQPNFDRIVAIKVMQPHIAGDRSFADRFMREAKVLASLRHPNIVTAYDVDHDEGACFFVMEYVSDRDLKSWIKQEGRLPIAWSCECIRQAALGLEHAHQQGVIHRDIKPGNLLIGGDLDGPVCVKLLDLGIARLVVESDSTALTQSGQVLGTPDYMAPEQGLKTEDIDIRADIYALGSTLYQMLTGELPFRGENPLQVMMARSSHDPPHVRESRPEVHPSLDAIVFRMMARRRDDRFATPTEVVQALAPYCNEPDSWTQPQPLLGQKRSLKWGLAVGVLVIGTLTLALWDTAPQVSPNKVDALTAQQSVPRSAATSRANGFPGNSDHLQTAFTKGSAAEILMSDRWQWGEPQKLLGDVNSSGVVTCPTLTTDELQIAYLRGYREVWLARRVRPDEPFVQLDLNPASVST